MTCTCCETGRCCNGADCTAQNASECAHNSGTFTAGGDCSVRACTHPSGDYFCQTLAPCMCAAQGFIAHPTATSCDCRIVADACPGYACSYCNTSTGECAFWCPAPRSCCAGNCCPLSQHCQGGTMACVNKCTTGTFCAGTGSAYACCAAGQKCCGPSGCLPVTVGSLSITYYLYNAVYYTDWIDSNLDVTGALTVAASGTATTAYGALAATPDGVSDLSECAGAYAVAGRVSASFCYMALIGKIGTSGVPFLLGTSYSGNPGNGRLFYMANQIYTSEQPGTYYLNITHTTDPCPGYTPAAIGEPIVYAAGEEPPLPAPGPGAALKDILKLGGIVSSPTCSCNARAAQMDAWGSWESLRRCREIVGWLKEESDNRELWFFSPAGYALVFAAVALAALKRFWKSNNQ